MTSGGSVKGIALAIVLTAACFLSVLVALRLLQKRASAALLTVVFLASTPIYVLAFLTTPADLGFLPCWMCQEPEALELAFGLFVYASGFFGGVLQLYNLADRSVSLRILIDIAESPAGELSALEIADSYSQGRGLGWMYRKRLDDLVEHRFIQVTGGSACLRLRGQRAAALFRYLRTWLRLGAFG
jgi:hypothetical protein